MPVHILVDHWEFKATEIFKLAQFYEDFHLFFVQEEYGSSSDMNFPEMYYWESRGTEGKELWIWWRGEKGVQRNTFFKRVMQVDMHALKVQDVEIMEGGKKSVAQKGVLEIIVDVRLVLDPNDQWTKSFLGPILEAFWKRIWRHDLEANKKELLKDSYKFQNYLRSYFKYPGVAEGSTLKAFAPGKGESG